MERRNRLLALHRLAGVAAFATIVFFMVRTALAEASGDLAEVAAAKATIVVLLPLLIVAAIAAGVTGRRLAAGRPAGHTAGKLLRMKLIGANGLLVLVPAALFLDHAAGLAEIDVGFAVVQAIEFIAGAANIVLFAMQTRDGLRLAGRLPRTPID
jgi:hypothetical protein